MTTIYEVAKHAGVSLSTVSRVLNGNKTVNEALRQKVEKAVEELNYRPNSVARSLAKNRSDSVGVLVSDLSSSYFGEMMKSIELTLRDAGKHTIITSGHYGLAQERDGMEFLISRNCDALILHVDSLSDDEIVAINNTKIPVVLVNRFVRQMQDNCICLNNEHGGYLATEHLIKLGHKKIAYITGPSDKDDAQYRKNGHMKALQDAGIEYDPQLVFYGNFLEKSGVEGIAALCENGIEFTAVACANDWMASGVMTALRDRGFSLPEDVSVIGFDNMHFAGHIYPKLTTIENPIRHMSVEAAKVILNKVYANKNKIQHLFQPKLVVRQSTAEVKK